MLNFININNMKRMTLILSLLLIVVLGYAQEQVFTIQNSEIITKSKFIENFPNGKFDNITEHTFRDSYNLTVGNQSYTVKGYINEGWENEPGDWHYFEIIYNGQKIFIEDYADGWNYLSQSLKSQLSPCTNAFFYKDLGNNTLMLCFTGVTIMSEPPYLTIVILRNGEATLVFNKRGEIDNIKKTNDELEFDLWTMYAEYGSYGQELSSGVKHTMTIKDGMIYYK